MATKTISVDMEAYGRLKKARKPGESFSDVIKRVIKPPLDVKAWIRKLQNIQIDPKAWDAVDRRNRAQRPQRLRKAS